MNTEELKTQLMFHKRVWDMEGVKAKFIMKDDNQYIGRVVKIETIKFSIVHVDRGSGREVKQHYYTPMAYLLDTEVLIPFTNLKEMVPCE